LIVPFKEFIIYNLQRTKIKIGGINGKEDYKGTKS